MSVSMSSSHLALPFLFDDRHAGETIFVVGAGPQLATVRGRVLERLQTFTTIAVNKVFFWLRPTYFLSAYVGEVMLAARRTSGAALLHMRPVLEPALVPGAIPLKRDLFEPGMDLPRRLDPLCPTLLTRWNVALGATHLAYVLGARRIVFVGVEQRNQLHFWNFDEDSRLAIRAALIDRGDPYASLGRDLATVDRSRDECMEPFYTVDHTPSFRAYFDILARNGVEVIATTAESVVADAGARIMDIDSVFETGEK
jgi:hypothetical protein